MDPTTSSLVGIIDERFSVLTMITSASPTSSSITSLPGGGPCPKRCDACRFSFRRKLSPRMLITVERWSNRSSAALAITASFGVTTPGARNLVSGNVIDRDGKTIVTAELDGNLDKTGLPDPFYTDFHFIDDGDNIAAEYSIDW